jgi:hypothetical protein
LGGVGLFIPTPAGPLGSPSLLSAFSRRAETVGFDSPWTVDDVAAPAQMASECNLLCEPMVVDRAVLRTTMRRNLAVTTTLAVAAAETSRVHLGTSVAVPLLRTTHITIRNRALANQERSGTARPIPPMQYATTVVCAGGVIDNPLVSPNSFEWL